MGLNLAVTGKVMSPMTLQLGDGKESLPSCSVGPTNQTFISSSGCNPVGKTNC